MKKITYQFLEIIKNTVHFLTAEIWQIPIKSLSPGKSLLLNQLRVFVIALHGVKEDKLLLRAPALTFYSLLSIVPLATLAFGIAQGFGLEMYLEQQLKEALIGQQEVYYWIMELSETYLQQIHRGTLAIFGLLLLLYTIIMLLTNIEKSFNEIWQVKRGRPLSRKISDYFAMMFIAPLLFIISGVVTVYLNTRVEEISSALLNPLLLFLVQLIPYILIWTLLTLLYMVMPNTRVQFSSALLAGVIAGTLFQLIQWGYVAFQIGAARYGAMYGSLAALPLLMIWMQISWVVILFGAELSFANHNIESYEFEKETKNISPFNKNILALYILHLLVQNFKKGENPATPKQISSTLQIPNSLVRNILNDLTAVNLVSEARTGYTKESAYQPAVDPNIISIKMALERLEHTGVNKLFAKPTPTLENLKSTLENFYDILEKSDQNKLLKNL
ncbi:MAG: YihY/virulence factor BrkB family protein [Bacillota bacterium]